MYDTIESLVYESAFEDVNKFSATLARFKAMVNDFEKEGISVPEVEAEFTDDNELDLLVTAEIE